MTKYFSRCKDVRILYVAFLSWIASLLDPISGQDGHIVAFYISVIEKKNIHGLQNCFAVIEEGYLSFMFISSIAAISCLKNCNFGTMKSTVSCIGLF